MAPIKKITKKDEPKPEVKPLEEGDDCPSCKKGKMFFFIQGCTCHLGNPPCSACVNAPLICDKCGYEQEEE